MIEGWILWLFIVGVGIGIAVAWLLLGRLPRGEGDVVDAERPVEAAWISSVIERHGGIAPRLLVEEVLDLHRAYLRRRRPPDEAGTAGDPYADGPPPPAVGPMATPRAVRPAPPGPGTRGPARPPSGKPDPGGLAPGAPRGPGPAAPWPPLAPPAGPVPPSGQAPPPGRGEGRSRERA